MFNTIKNFFAKPTLIATYVQEYRWRYSLTARFHEGTLTVMLFMKNNERSYKIIDSEEYSTASKLVMGECEIWVNGGPLPRHAKMVEKE